MVLTQDHHLPSLPSLHPRLAHISTRHACDTSDTTDAHISSMHGGESTFFLGNDCFLRGTDGCIL